MRWWCGLHSSISDERSESSWKTTLPLMLLFFAITQYTAWRLLVHTKGSFINCSTCNSHAHLFYITLELKSPNKIIKGNQKVSAHNSKHYRNHINSENKKGREKKQKNKADMITRSEIRFKQNYGRSSMGLLRTEMHFLKKSLTHTVTFCDPPACVSQMGCQIQSSSVLGRFCTHEN